MNNSPRKLIGALVRKRLIVLLVLLVASGMLLGYTIFDNRPSASSLTTATPAPTVKLPAEFGQVQQLNSQIKTAILTTSGSSVCSMLATRSPLLETAISELPNQAQSLFFDSSTLAKIKPLSCATNTVEQPNTTIAGSTQVSFVDSFNNASTAPDENYAVTTSSNTLYSLAFSDYLSPAKSLPQSGQTTTATGTLINQMLLTTSQATTVSGIQTRAVTKSQLGVHKLLVLFFTFLDSPTPSPYSLTDPALQAGVKSSLQANQAFWSQATWGQIKFQGQNASVPADYKFVSLGVAPIASAFCANDSMGNKTFAWLNSQLASSGISNYDNVVAIAPFNSKCAAFGGLTDGIPSKLTFIDGTSSDVLYTSIIGHELGHQLGLNHGGSYVYPCLETGTLNCHPGAVAYYGDSYNVMGINDIESESNPGAPPRTYPAIDIPGIDKQVLGVIPPAASGEATLTSSNTASNPLIVDLYSLEANPAFLPANDYQHFEVSSSLFDYDGITKKLDIEYRPSINGGNGAILFHLDDRGNPDSGESPELEPNATHVLVNNDFTAYIPLHRSLTISNVTFQFADVVGSVAIVKISEEPDPCDSAPTISNYQPALSVSATNPAPVITNNYKITSNAPTTCATQQLNLSANIDTSRFPSNLKLSSVNLVSGSVSGSPIAVSLPVGSSLTVTATLKLTNTQPLVLLTLGSLPSLKLTIGICGG